MDGCWKLYRLNVVTGGAEPQEGYEIAQARIVDSKVYPSTNAPIMVFVPEGTVVVAGDCFVTILFFFKNNNCHVYWLTSQAALAWHQGLESLP